MSRLSPRTRAALRSLSPLSRARMALERDAQQELTVNNDDLDAFGSGKDKHSIEAAASLQMAAVVRKSTNAQTPKHGWGTTPGKTPKITDRDRVYADPVPTATSQSRNASDDMDIEEEQMPIARQTSVQAPLMPSTPAQPLPASSAAQLVAQPAVSLPPVSFPGIMHPPAQRSHQIQHREAQEQKEQQQAAEIEQRRMLQHPQPQSQRKAQVYHWGPPIPEGPSMSYGQQQKRSS
jgi:hypothetical protein